MLCYLFNLSVLNFPPFAKIHLKKDIPLLGGVELHSFGLMCASYP
jgi:hypothetical protein